MKTISTIRLTVAATALFLFCAFTMSAKDGEPKGAKTEKAEINEKVLICHVPPGNPSNKQDLWVSPSAVAAHLAHGDFMGSCEKKQDPCKECEVQRQNCIANAGGDKDLLLLCESGYKKCRAECDGEAPPPAEPGGGGK